MSLVVRVLLACAAVAALLTPSALGAPRAGSSVRSFGENGFATQVFGTEPSTGGAKEWPRCQTVASWSEPNGAWSALSRRRFARRRLGEDGYLLRL